MFLFLWIFSSAMAAQEPVIQTWRIKAIEIRLTEASERGLINPSCLLDRNCEALKAIQNKSKNIPSLAGGTNPGSTVCRKKNGVVVIAERSGSSQGLCRFKDGSYASLDGLFK